MVNPKQRRQAKPDRGRVLLIAALTVVTVLIILVARAAYLHFVKGFVWAHGTGFGPQPYPQPTTQYRPGKTFWDWLQPLIVPIVLSVGGLLLSAAQRRNDQKLAHTRVEN